MTNDTKMRTLQEWLPEVRQLLGQKSGLLSQKAATNMWVDGLTPTEAAATFNAKLASNTKGDK